MVIASVVDSAAQPSGNPSSYQSIDTRDTTSPLGQRNRCGERRNMYRVILRHVGNREKI